MRSSLSTTATIASLPHTHHGVSRVAGEPQFRQYHSDTADAVRAEILEGLTRPQAHISPKFLYDELGSSLFCAITLLEEYYPTRCENQIFMRHAREIAAHAGSVRTLVDLGAGDCVKAEKLLPIFQPERYVPVDISVDYLRTAAKRIAGRFPDIEVTALGMDFFDELSLPNEIPSKERSVFYPGSSIGNLAPEHAAELLGNIRRQCEGGALIIGVDLVKDRGILEPAYDDALGVTAAFNLNMLRHVNRVLGANFDASQWQHAAWFNEARSRIEMHLRARTSTTVKWVGGERHFSEGDHIHTEDSYKYRPSAFKSMLASAGFAQVRYWTDDREWFAVFCARA